MAMLYRRCCIDDVPSDVTKTSRLCARIVDFNGGRCRCKQRAHGLYFWTVNGKPSVQIAIIHELEIFENLLKRLIHKKLYISDPILRLCSVL